MHICAHEQQTKRKLWL